MLRTTLVVPCFNEAIRLDPEAFRAAAGPGASPWLRFVFVDDGSTDETRSVLEKVCSSLGPARAEMVVLGRNRGKAEAVRRGAIAAFEHDPEAVGYWDADLSTPLGELEGMMRVLEGRPDTIAVMGSRVRLMGRRIERRPGRHYMGRVFATGAALVLGFPVYDTQCGAKLFRAVPEVRAALTEPFLTRWAFDLEVLARLRRVFGPDPGATSVIVEHPLSRWEDVGGSKVRARDTVEIALALWRIHRRYR